MTAFEELGVLPQLGKAVSDLGWKFPTPIQCEAIPAILGGGDVLIAAETGSGKTGSFCLPVAQIIWERRKDALEGRKSNSEPRSWRLNLSDRDLSLSVGLDGLSCESRIPKAWFGARASGAVHTKGKYYFEAKITREGLCGIGWSTGTASLNLGTDINSFGFGGNGKKSHNRQFDDYGESFTTGDIMGCFLDLDNLAIWWAKNGFEFPRAYNIDKKFCSIGLHPAILVQNSSLLLNFGQTDFSFPPRNEFTSVFNTPISCTHWRGANIEANTTDPICIVLEPTRELVEQTHKNIELFSKRLSSPAVRCLSVAAGVSMEEVIANLKLGTDVLTSTPKRIVDLVETGQLSLRSLQFIVIDEADQCLFYKKGESQLLLKLMRMMPPVASDGSRLQVIVCSATLHNMDINQFAEKFIPDPRVISQFSSSFVHTRARGNCISNAFLEKMSADIKRKLAEKESAHLFIFDMFKWYLPRLVHSIDFEFKPMMVPNDQYTSIKLISQYIPPSDSSLVKIFHAHGRSFEYAVTHKFGKQPVMELKVRDEIKLNERFSGYTLKHPSF